MKVHGSAALGPAGRLALVEAIESGMTQKAAAAAFCVAPATAHRWWHRWRLASEAERRAAWRGSEPLDRLSQASSSLVEAGLLGQLGEEITKVLAGDREEAAIGGDAHDRLGDAEGRDLGVGDPATGISGLFGQEIVCRAINDCAESVEVGVHRGLQVDGDLSTADFGLSALKSSITAFAVESTI
jgi:hypothetical protein